MAVLLRENVYQAIRRAILTCELQPGQELREQILAEKYHVSRSPVRDSLLRLEQENLVTVLPRQGYRVNPILRRDVEDLYGLRVLIEPACAAQAARADDAALVDLNRFRGFAAQPTGYTGFLEHNRAFHRAIADLSGNRRIAAVGHSLIEEFDRLIWAAQDRLGEIAAAGLLRQHDAIIDAIQAHDVDGAHRLALEHVVSGYEQIIAVLQPMEMSDH